MSPKYVTISIVTKTLLCDYRNMLIGYARVSTEDQNLDLQRDALKAAGCIRIFEEKESGRAGTKRPALEAALDFLRAEDQLVVWKIDRLGRSLREMLDTAHMLQERGVKLRSLTEQVDTETATGRMMFNFLGTIAEYFLDLNRERTLAGLKAAVARGRKGGRPRKITDADLEAGRAMLAAGTIPVAEIAKRLGVSRKTFYLYFPQARARSQAQAKG
ncbi:resolvase domain-containing protein (plasmid) [Methylorubrum populi]|uniref:Resolvase domain-containing protein n=2 Tax=Methylobacteriaceae TaxID=119045 RepID=A0A160PPM0_9HYPH|nr:resolvase domain-containing protein [Methylorubrum populi]